MKCSEMKFIAREKNKYHRKIIVMPDASQSAINEFCGMIEQSKPGDVIVYNHDFIMYDISDVRQLSEDEVKMWARMHNMKLVKKK